MQALDLHSPMDALALLCTIHADGPSTLARLRAAGVASLADVAACEPASLAQALRAGAAQARRFQREAEGLAARLDAETPGRPAPARKAPRRAPSSKVDKPAPVPAAPEASAPATDAGPRTLEDVLARWRTLDGQNLADELPAKRAAPATEAASVSSERTEPACAAMTLSAGALDGIDERAAALLAGCGVTTLEALAHCDPLAAAAGTGLAYTSLVRWRGLAARSLRAAPRLSPAEPRAEDRGPSARVVAPPVSDYVLQPAPRAMPPRPEAPSQESAAGPFA